MNLDLEIDPLPSPSKVFHPAPLTSSQWRDIRIERTRRAKQQVEGFESAEIFKASIEAKLNAAGCVEKWFQNMKRCGRESFYTICLNCQTTKECFYNCSNRLCPRCNFRIAGRRRDLLEKMTNGVCGCKHVVVTQRNFTTPLRPAIIECRKNLNRLRKQKLFGKVSGGCASMEITNEGKGWHVHWHMLIQSSSFFPAKDLAVVWGKLVGQSFAIVKVKSVDDASYLGELCKYAAKPAEVAKWPAEQIYEFCEAVQKTRMFTVFGRFAQIRRWAQMEVKRDALERHAGACECGCSDRVFGPSESSCIRQLSEGRF